MGLLSRVSGLFRRGRSGKALEERRNSARVVVPIEALAVMEGQERGFSIQIRDLGLYGLRLEVPQALSVGSFLGVRVLRGQGVMALGNFEVDTIRVKVVWSRRKPRSSSWLAGVKYADTTRNLKTSWIRFMIDKFGVQLTYAQRRKNIRVSTNLPVTVLDEARPPFQAKLVDLGVGGAMLALREDLPQGHSLKVALGPWKDLEKIGLRARVMRCRISQDTQHWLVGVSFVDASYDDYRLLTDYLLRMMEAER